MKNQYPLSKTAALSHDSRVSVTWRRHWLAGFPNLRFIATVALGLLLVASGKARAQYTIRPFDVPGSTYTDASGINDLGRIVGAFVDTGGRTHGYLRVGPRNFTTLDFPGADGTLAIGINNSGRIVGFFFDSAGNRRGFVKVGPSFKRVNVPGSTQTRAIGINSAGQIVGDFLDTNGVWHGYLSAGPQNFTTINFPGATYTGAFGINDAGQIVGFYADRAGVQHGFLKNGASFIRVDFPGSTLTSLTGINNAGIMAGDYEDDASGVFHAFVTDLSTFTKLDIPNCDAMCGGSAHGPNNGGVLVGLIFQDLAVGHGFVATPSTR